MSRLHQEYLPKNNLTFNGKHHEIYLSDPRKTPAPKLKTILRQPVRRGEKSNVIVNDPRRAIRELMRAIFDISLTTLSVRIARPPTTN